MTIQITTRHLIALLVATSILASAVGYTAATLANPSASDAAARAMAVKDKAVLSAVQGVHRDTTSLVSAIGSNALGASTPSVKDSLAHIAAVLSSGSATPTIQRLLKQICENAAPPGNVSGCDF